jgi:Tc toxin complex TcA C-terminal TcB-binding domain/Neuraminidase-like domain/Salmonella virulence plasmid 28.1kDa A protein
MMEQESTRQKKLVVRGVASYGSGLAAAGLLVRAYDKDMRSEQLLGETKTDKSGKYEIDYSAKQFALAEAGTADLRISLCNPEGREIGTSAILFNAPTEAVINVTLPTTTAGPSEFERLVAAVAPLLQGVAPQDLTDSDLDFLAGDTALPRENIRLFSLAEKSSLATSSTQTAAYVRLGSFGGTPRITTEAFYGWYRKTLPTDIEQLFRIPDTRLIATLKKAIEENLVPASLAARLDQLSAILASLRGNQLLKSAPAAGRASLADVLQMLAGEAALRPEQLQQFALLRADTPATDLWNRASDSGFSTKQITGLQRILTLNKIVNGETALLRQAITLPAFTQTKDTQPLLEIAALESADWYNTLKAVRPADTDDTAVQIEAATLVQKTANLMPNDFLFVRVSQAPESESLSANLNQIAKLQANNGKDILNGAFGDLNTDEISAADLPAVQTAFQDTRILANTYPGLRLADVVAERGTVTDKSAEIQRRVLLVGKLFSQNPQANLLGLDYLAWGTDLKTLNVDGLSGSDQKMALRVAKAYQRIHRITDNAVQTLKITKAGFSSSAAIGRLTLERFAQDSGMTLAEAYAVHEAAKDRATDASLHFMAINDYVQKLGAGGESVLSTANASPAMVDQFRKLDGFDDLFGAQTICNCTHCQSVLSPAAYFVDMMRYIDVNVTQKVFVGAQANHSFKLKNRRPDLWSLELTCDNTETLIPTLDIINDILEQFVFKSQGLTATAGDPQPTQAAVYRRLKDAKDSFLQPFVLPLRRIEAYISHFDRTRADVARVLGVDSTTYTRARLGLSLAEWSLITSSAQTNSQLLKQLYPPEVTGPVFLTPPAVVDMQDLLNVTRWTRNDLGELMAAKFVRSGTTITITSGKQSADSVQNDIEMVKGIDPGVLDRLHRFTRLWKKVGWTIEELDLVLSTIATGANLVLGSNEVIRIAQIVDLQSRFSISVAEACALFASISQTSLDDRPSLFDRLFNLEPFLSKDGSWPQSNQTFTHPSTGGGTSSPDNIALQRLLAGLQVGDADFVNIGYGLTAEQLLTPAQTPPLHAPPYFQSFALNLENLTLLFRHRRLAQLLNLPIPQLFQLITLGKVEESSGNPTDPWIYLNKLLDVYDKWKISGFGLDDIATIIGGPVLQVNAYPDPAAAAADIETDIKTTHALEFADTVFAQLDGITEGQSRAIVAANPTIFESIGTSLRLQKAFDPANGAVTIPVGITVDIKSLRELLYKFHSRGILASKIAPKIGFTEQKVRSISVLLGSVLETHDPNLLAELQAGTGPATLLTAIIQKLLPLALLFRSTAWDLEESGYDPLQFVSENPGIFSLTNPVETTAISLDSVWNVAAYSRLATVSDADFTPDKPAADSESVRSVLKNGFGDNAVVAKALRVPQSQVAALSATISPVAGKPFDTLRALSDCLALASYLSVSGETLKKIVPSEVDADKEFTALLQAAESLYGAIRVKYPDETTFQQKVEPYEDKIRGLKRSGLVEFMIRSAQQGFSSTDDLYQYFLMDTQVEGCSRTSKVVAACSSLQLYVYRIKMNLEQTDQSAPHPLQVSPSLIDDEWDWRQYYRVWEANRKVFLFPESYIEPELRDDKTPLFEDLEATLLQKRISDDNATDAYAEYLAGFDEVAKLNIAGSFHDIDQNNGVDILHIFGVTACDPPIYYYRAVSNLLSGPTKPGRWTNQTAWRKVDVQIPVRKVSPIVFRGRLYVFWVEISTNGVNSLVAGTSTFVGYRHKISVKYTRLKPGGTWSAAHTLSCDPELPGVTLAVNEGLIITIPAVGTVLGPAVGSAADNAPLASNAGTKKQVPIYDPQQRNHTEMLEGYTLSGFQWDEVYPSVDQQNQRLLIQFRNFRESTELSADGSSLKSTTISQTGESQPILITTTEIEPYDRLLLATIFPPVTIPLLIEAACEIVAGDVRNCDDLGDEHYMDSSGHDSVLQTMQQFESQIPQGLLIATLSGEDEVLSTNGNPMGAIVKTQKESILLCQIADPSNTTFRAIRLNSAASESLIQTLFSDSLAKTLSLDSQINVAAAPALPINMQVKNADDSAGVSPVPFDLFASPYLRELFFHIPFLVANQLNSQQQYSECQNWYHYIFNPTSTDTDPDRVWRFFEFRGIKDNKPDFLRRMITDPDALNAYRKDPFNPHAIARLRLSAYQKAVVMKYIDNLIDWGDTLFTEFTMESVNEATMLYVMAADILGPRSAEVGDCGESDIASRTYEAIEPSLNDTSDFLIEMEHIVQTGQSASKNLVNNIFSDFHAQNRRPLALISGENAEDFGAPTTLGNDGPSPGMFQPLGEGATGVNYWRTVGGTGLQDLNSYSSGTNFQGGLIPGLGSGSSTPNIFTGGDPINPTDAGILGFGGTIPGTGGLVPFASGLFNQLQVQPGIQSPDGTIPFPGKTKYPPFNIATEVAVINPVFCFPANPDLLAYWDRVDDRLFKIRNCMDITGSRRQLSLFAPEIDPRLLVLAKASGLELGDVLGASAGDLPPYRFVFMIEKAKQFVSTVQAFGNALAAALEKKDAEALNSLRTVHEQNLLKMRSRLQDLEIESAQDSVDALERQKDLVTYRKAFYEGLLDSGLAPWEQTQQVMQHSANALLTLSAILSGAGGILSLLPQLGAPTSMNYGGIQVKESARFWAKVSEDTAHLLQLGASSAGIEATFQRRAEEWKNQANLAARELDSIQKQIDAANVRLQIAQRSSDIHQKSIDQAEEIFEFLQSKFTNTALYTFLSTKLNTLYLAAFNAAFAVAKMAEQAFVFERSDDKSTRLKGGYWSTAQAGLTAGDQLLLDLQQLELQFLQKNYRQLEVEQSFSVAQFAPDALESLREKGTCTWSVPEWFFDLTYPGQYNRRLKAVRLTIPCVVGPFSNVGATLELSGSRIRHDAASRDPKNLDQGLIPEPLRHTVRIATSKGQSDAGVFEFSFRDERYMPFEGAGAVSDWSLTLPNTLRAFDYTTVSDVILNLSYTADFEGSLKDTIEDETNGLVNLLHSLAPLKRLVSLRRDFPDAYYRLISSPLNTQVDVRLGARQFPFYLGNRTLAVVTANLHLTVAANSKLASLDGASFAIGENTKVPAATISFKSLPGAAGVTKGSFGDQDFDFGDILQAGGAGGLLSTLYADYSLKVTNAGPLAPAAPASGGGAIDPQKLSDIILEMNYGFA